TPGRRVAARRGARSRRARRLHGGGEPDPVPGRDGLEELRWGMDPRLERQLLLTRRQCFGTASYGIGAAALAVLLGRDLGASPVAGGRSSGGLPGLPHFEPRARRVISLFQSGAPSQLDLFDPK